MELSLKLTNICNEKCPYCIADIPLIAKAKITKPFDPALVPIRLNKYDFKKVVEIGILGGEPGLISREEFEILINYLYDRGMTDDKITVSTNGLFLDKYKEFYPTIDYKYHIISKNKFKQYNGYNIEYTYIIYNIESVIELMEIAELHPDIIIYAIIDEKKEDFDMNFIQIYQKLVLNYPNVKHFKEYNLPSETLERVFMSSFGSEKIFRIGNKFRRMALNCCYYVDLF